MSHLRGKICSNQTDSTSNVRVAQNSIHLKFIPSRNLNVSPRYRRRRTLSREQSSDNNTIGRPLADWISSRKRNNYYSPGLHSPLNCSRTFLLDRLERIKRFRPYFEGNRLRDISLSGVPTSGENDGGGEKAGSNRETNGK